jgi:MarR family transcriptional regulator for hemolysin
MPDFENDLLVLLSDVARHMRPFGNQLAQQHGMTFAQLTILARLEGEPELSQNELAAITELAPMTVARLVDRLEKLGVVKRCADPKDRRTWRLRLTPVASPLVRDIKALRAKLFLVSTQGINASALGTMARGLRQMKENVSSQLLAEMSKLERIEHFADSIQRSVREDPPPADKADLETAERDCWRMLSNIDPQPRESGSH